MIEQTVDNYIYKYFADLLVGIVNIVINQKKLMKQEV